MIEYPVHQLAQQPRLRRTTPLEKHWHDQHLAGLGYPGAQKSIRRAGSVLLVQWAAGGSMRDAAEYLGIRTGQYKYLLAPGLARWLSQPGRTGSR